MKKLILFLFLAVITHSANAQAATPAAGLTQGGMRFGYFSYQKVFEAMPDYTIAKRNMDDLRIKYDNEMKRVEDEFNKKYEEFLEGQRDFAQSILQKRQAELQDLMEKNIAFKQEAKRLLKEAENEAYKPLKAKLSAALAKVGQERGLAFILNTDNQAVPYVNGAIGEDVTAAVKAAIR